MPELCEVCPAGSDILAGHVAHYEARAEPAVKTDFKVCAMHAAAALRGGAVVTKITY